MFKVRRSEGDKITTVDSNLIAEALCQIAEVHIKDKFLIDRKV